LQDVPAEGAPDPGLSAGRGSRTLRNTGLVLSARVVSRVLALVTAPLIIQHLQAGDYGRFQVVINVTGLVAVMVDLGFNTLYQREAARRPAELNRYLSNLVSARLLFSVAALVVLSGALALLGEFEYIAPAFVMMVLASYSNLLRGTLYAVQRLGYEVVAIILESLVLLGLVVYGVISNQSVAYFLWAYAASYAFSCVYFLIVLTLRRIARIRWLFEPELVRTWFWAGLPFAMAFVITTVYFKVDVPILKLFRGDVETGYYAAAYKLFEALLFVPISMLNVVFPVLAIYYKERNPRLGWAVGRFYKALLAIGWPTTIGIFLMAPAFHPIYRLPEAEPALRILALGIVFMFVSNAFIAALNAIDRQVLFTWSALVSMVANILLNVALIPVYGYIGASWATVLTEIVLCLVGGVLLTRHLARLPLLAMSWKIVLAGLLMGAVLVPFRNSTGYVAIAVILGGAAIYALALALLRAADPEERALMRKALHR
jgi:O-antigen/teichoic acid export membrane protein